MLQLLEFFQLCGVSLFNFAVLEPMKTGGGMIMKGDKRPRDVAEVVRCMPWAGARNHAGYDVYVRPARYDAFGNLADHAVLFFDDLPVEMAARICTKYKACAVETSKDNCQVWLGIDRPLTEIERLKEQTLIAEKIGSDKKSVSGEHFGRAVGFRNKKKNRGNEFVKIVSMSTDRQAYIATKKEVSSFSPPAAARGLGLAYRINTQSGGGDSDKEFAFACISLEKGMDRNEVKRMIADHAFNRGKRKSYQEAVKYAEKTVIAAEKRCCL